MRLLPASWLLVLAIAACAPDPGSSKPVGGKKPITYTPGNAVTGHVYAPKGSKAGTYGLLLAGDPPLAQAPIFSVEADGTNTTRPWGRTDAQGAYSVGQLPVDKLLRVQAKLDNGNLETLAKAGQAKDADLDIASTMLTATLVAHGKNGVVTVDMAAYAKALTALQAALANDTPPNPADAGALVTRTEAFAKGIKDVNAVVGGTFTGELPSTSPAASPGPGASPSPVPSPSPSPSP